jgi:hypothetical protein
MVKMQENYKNGKYGITKIYKISEKLMICQGH